MSETVLERNISFIDSPGFATKSELNPDRLPLIAHLEQLFQRNSAMPELGSSELLNILSGAGGVQVDVVLYICAPAGQSHPSHFDVQISDAYSRIDHTARLCIHDQDL